MRVNSLFTMRERGERALPPPTPFDGDSKLRKGRARENCLHVSFATAAGRAHGTRRGLPRQLLRVPSLIRSEAGCNAETDCSLSHGLLQQLMKCRRFQPFLQRCSPCRGVEICRQKCSRTCHWRRRYKKTGSRTRTSTGALGWT